MKFVKRISLFFIYPLGMFALGFASNMAITEFFYPGEEKAQAPAQAKEENANEEEILSVSFYEEPVITANTQYFVQAYNAVTGDTKEEKTSAPDKFIGLNREKLTQEISAYNANPSLTDQEMGFYHMELVSFSPEKVVVRKSYEFSEKERGFFLLNENHYVAVYNHDLSQLYMNTDILVESLPDHLQEEILNMKFVENEETLYNFLESYSS